MDQICNNCEASGDGLYCSNCGQKYNVPSFTFKHILHEAFHAFTHADKSFPAFVKQLILNPGLVAREFIIERKRKKYFNPFTFFVLITALNAFVEGRELALKEKLFHFNNEYGHIFNIYDKLLSLIIIPITAFFVWLIHIKKPRIHYSEYTVFVMMLLSLISIADVVVHSLNYCFTAWRHTSVDIEDTIVYPILIALYMAYANYQFHLKVHKSSLFQSMLTGVMIFIVQLGVELFIVYSVINHFHGLGTFEIYGVKIN